MSHKIFAKGEGFTLLEVLITLVLISVGLASLMPMFSIAMVLDAQAEQSGIALNLAREKMEELRGVSTYAAIDSHASPALNVGGDFSDFRRSVTVSGSDPKEVNITVYWSLKGDEQSVRLVSLFTDYDY